MCHSSEIEQASELEDIMIMSKEHPFAFEETFCTAYEMLDDMWVEDPPTNILFFNTLLTRCTGNVMFACLFARASNWLMSLTLIQQDC